MEIFRKAKSVRLMSYRDKYLSAEEDEESIIQQDEEQRRRESVWTVELVEGRDAVRLRSCFGTYLTASNIPLLPGVTAKKAVQTSLPLASDPAIEWEPVRDGMQVKLRSCCGNFLRPNGGLPPWRNMVTHDISHLPNSGNKLLWDVHIVDKRPRHATPNFANCRSGSFSDSIDALKTTSTQDQYYI
ncbi:actin cross-linking protein [Perilla frutescens var. hirtella]|uniref:Actin cross-linking protein n=1 Tax=Perilla frutescens var. hirtella TaxID=608512 RepID=A0AAD4P573_PERFH|nr:actin cross-linking protein [Perilla frutescens var. hirtella]